MTLSQKVRRRAAVVILVCLTVASSLIAFLPDGEAPRVTSMMRARAKETGASEPPQLRWVELGRVSTWLICAVVKAEDRLFFRHWGFDWGQLRKAALKALDGSLTMGGSTISQQLARNLYLDGERTVRRKLLEALITAWLEARRDKADLLELYLNVIEWGEGVWGIDAAAAHYFGKAPAALDAGESLWLASLIANPRAAWSGANRERMRDVYRRVNHQLLFSGLHDATQWAALERAWDDLAGGSGERPSSGEAPLLEDVIASECGLEREIDNTARARSARQTR